MSSPSPAASARAPQRRDASADRAYGSYEELLADPAVDAVYISLPGGMHHAWTMRAISAGKHVLCEKPYSRFEADVDAALEAAERSGLVIAEALMWRHHPQALRLAELVAGGAIGELRLVRAAFRYPLGDRAQLCQFRPFLASTLETPQTRGFGFLQHFRGKSPHYQACRACRECSLRCVPPTSDLDFRLITS